MDPQQACQRIIELEQQLLDPVVRADAVRIDALLHPSFIEHGASGRLLSRQAVLAELPLEDATTAGVRGMQFDAEVVADGAILLASVSRSPSPPAPFCVS